MHFGSSRAFFRHWLLLRHNKRYCWDHYINLGAGAHAMPGGVTPRSFPLSQVWRWVRLQCGELSLSGKQPRAPPGPLNPWIETIAVPGMRCGPLNSIACRGLGQVWGPSPGFPGSGTTTQLRLIPPILESPLPPLSNTLSPLSLPHCYLCLSSPHTSDHWPPSCVDVLG